MTEHILSMIGLAKKAGQVAIGEEPVGSAARAKRARVIFVAQDAAPSSVRRAQSFARTGSTLCVTLPAGKDRLGRSLGRTSVAMCAVTDIGFAGAIAKKLAAMDGGKYGAAAAQLDVKAQRAMERRAEQARHEKNLRQGKRRIHSDKPPETEHPPEEKAAKPPRSGEKRPYRKSGSPPKKRSQRPEERFAGSLPVKRGKGSSRKKSGQQ